MTILTTLAAAFCVGYTHRRGFRIRRASRFARALRFGLLMLAHSAGR